MESFLPSQFNDQKHIFRVLQGGEKEISCRLITVLEMLGIWHYFSWKQNLKAISNFGKNLSSDNGEKWSLGLRPKGFGIGLSLEKEVS